MTGYNNINIIYILYITVLKMQKALNVDLRGLDVRERRKVKADIRSRLIWLSVLLVALAFCMVLGVFEIYRINTSAKLEKLTFDLLDDIADTYKATITTEVGAQFTTLKSMAGYFTAKPELTDEERLNIMTSAVRSRALISMSYFDKNGVGISTDGVVKNASNEDYFKSAMQGSPAISESVGGEYAKHRYVTFAVPVYRAGEAHAVLGGVYDVALMQKAISASGFFVDGYICVVSGQGDVIFYSDTESVDRYKGNLYEQMESGRLLPEEGEGTMRSNMLERRKGASFVTDDGVRKYVIYTPLDVNGWYLFCIVPESTISGNYSFIQSDMVVVTVVILAAFALLLGYVALVNRYRRSRINSERNGLEIMERRYRLLFEKSNVMIFEFDAQAEEILFTDDADELRPAGAEAVVSYSDILKNGTVHPEDVDKVEAMALSMRTEDSASDEVRIRSISGAYYWYEVQCVAAKDAEGRLIKVVGSITNIDDKHRERESLKLKAETDAMTGLLNKNSTEKYIRDYLQGEGRHGRHVLLVLDVDRFKQINDEYGHLQGDKMLVHMARLITKLFRTDDITGRVGGDEFVVLMKNMSDVEAIKRKGIALSARHTVRGESSVCTITCSVGMTLINDEDASYETIFSRADKALYAAKNAGRSCCAIDDGKITMIVRDDRMLGML